MALVEQLLSYEMIVGWWYVQLTAVRHWYDDDDELMLNVLRCHLTY